jgi:hypothetical protein
MRRHYLDNVGSRTNEVSIDDVPHLTRKTEKGTLKRTIHTMLWSGRWRRIPGAWNIISLACMSNNR